MKFPTTTPMFPPVALSPAERKRYEQLAKGLVSDTLADYDAYNSEDKRQVSKQLWKPIKARENITVYKDRSYDSDDNLHRGLASSISVSTATNTTASTIGRGHAASAASRSSSNSASSRSSRSSSSLSAAMLDSLPVEEWTLPKMLMVGTLSGTLDDVMYGLATPDVGLVLLKAHYAQDEVIDAQVLAQIQGPSPVEPYRFLGLKWLVKGNPPAVKALVLPRDLILLETTGVMNHPTTNERIGYFLMHSVSIPSCFELPKRAAVRGRISSCYIFKELGNGVVDVYMKGFVEASGKIADAVAIISAANGLLCCWKAVVCSQSKKLVWAIKARARGDVKRRLTSSQQQAQSQLLQDNVCGMCAKGFKRYSRVACCQLCDGAMCSRCRVNMKLAFPRAGEKDIRLKNVIVCKKCITTSNQQSTFEVAQQEVLSGRFGSAFTSGSSAASSVSSGSSSVASVCSRPSSSSDATIKRSTVGSMASGSNSASPDDIGSSILLAQAQEYAKSSVPGSGGTILLAHAQDRALASKSVSRRGTATDLTSTSVASSAANTAKSSEFSSHYSESSDYESFDDESLLRPSEDDLDETFASVTAIKPVDEIVITSSEWSAVSPSARQQYLDTVQGRTPEEQAMWKRMAQLHLQAENLYQFTKKNTETLMQGGTAASEMPGGAPAAVAVGGVDYSSLSPRMSID